MIDASWEKRKQLLADALEMPEAERESFLLTAAAGDTELHKDIASLLKYAVEPDERFDAVLLLTEPWLTDTKQAARSHDESEGNSQTGEPQGDSSFREAAHWLRPGSIIGHYKILRLIGSGGMGDVFEAEQDRPRRLVALKVLRAGPTSPDSQRRFEFEAELLGRLHHPGIAQVYEAGAFRPGESTPIRFLAMELVTGTPLIEYAQNAKLDLRERLQLLVRVCEAVEHAHQRGVIHRDLKPANILIESASRADAAGGRVGQPKLLDFGIARSVDNANTDNPRTQFTRAGDLLGTVQYMSPEQLAGDALAVTTKTDVYALGVLAYRLLTGEYPYGRMSSVMSAAEAIRTREPT
ncbi:MAG: serine/threonine protein kinase, partial [Phycisphaerales bacterium]|nr:serine/threonine protein kinase [Phycisphaerales bacterium]